MRNLTNREGFAPSPNPSHDDLEYLAALREGITRIEGEQENLWMLPFLYAVRDEYEKELGVSSSADVLTHAGVLYAGTVGNA